MKLTAVDLAIRANRRPRLHPNGFIQLDLTEDGRTRLHVWPDRSLPAQVTRHTIHDHIFDMVSTVVCGRLVNRTYRWSPDHERGKFQHYVGVHNPASQDTVLQPTGLYGDTALVDEVAVDPGEIYWVPARHLHDSLSAGLTATVMTKVRIVGVEPYVCVPRDVEPDNEYRRESGDEDVLWDFIRRALEEAECHKKVTR